MELCYVGSGDGIVLCGERLWNCVMWGVVMELCYVESGDGIVLCGER
jgi:hypothetical protein